MRNLRVIDGVADQNPHLLASDRGADGFGPGAGVAVSHAPAEHVVGHFAGVGAFVLG